MRSSYYYSRDETGMEKQWIMKRLLYFNDLMQTEICSLLVVDLLSYSSIGLFFIYNT